jgi:L-methionine (R)-S-oxide reductase
MENKKQVFDSLMEEINMILEGPGKIKPKMQVICQLLQDRIPYYNWVGFYLGEESTRMLELGPFVGEPTIHVKIPFGSGICGQAAERKEPFMIQDISQELNYLSCSVHVKAEFVVPIFKDGKIAGELDIDSHTSWPFSDEDRVFLGQICAGVGPRL